MSDYLFRTNFTIEQREDMYHFNSDSVLLGSFLDVKKKDTVLEVGCAQGAILLYASLGEPAILHGIDLFEEVIEQARLNLRKNGVNAECFVSSVQDFSKEHRDRYSLIFCNPPFFKVHPHTLRKCNPYLSAARHDSYLPLPELFSSVKKLLKENGRFEIVHRASYFSVIVKEAMKEGFSLTRMRPVYDHEGGKAKSILLEFRRTNGDSEMKLEPPAYLDKHETFFLKENL